MGAKKVIMMLQYAIQAKSNESLGDCTCLHKFEKDTISESLQGNLNTVNELLKKREIKKKRRCYVYEIS